MPVILLNIVTEVLWRQFPALSNVGLASVGDQLYWQVLQTGYLRIQYHSAVCIVEQRTDQLVSSSLGITAGKLADVAGVELRVFIEGPGGEGRAGLSDTLYRYNTGVKCTYITVQRCACLGEEAVGCVREQEVSNTGAPGRLPEYCDPAAPRLIHGSLRCTALC